MIANNLFVRKPCKQGCPDRKELTIMKSKEELNALKEEVETVNEKLQELTEEELEQVTGGSNSELDFQLGLEYVTTQK